MMMLSRLVIKRKVAMASRAIGLLSSKLDEIRMVSTSTATRDFIAVESNLHFGVIGVTILLMTQQQHNEEGASHSVKCEARTRTVTRQPWQDPSATLAKTAHSNPENDTTYQTSGRGAPSLNGKYTVNWEVVVGKGAYASVYPARSTLTGEKVALKQISKRNTTSSCFKTEKEAMLRIYGNGGHSNIAGLRDVYEDDNNYYVILDLVSGGEMYDHLTKYGAYSEADAARLMYEIASALAFLHDAGIVHADLKTENLLLDSEQRIDGVIKMIDFGCAAVCNKDGSVPADVPSANSNGTTAYWPPERFQAVTAAEPTMDMWAVGVILYIMLTGAHPFDLHDDASDEKIEDQIQENPYPPLGEGFTDHLSESAVDLIQRLMEPNPVKRMTAHEMINHSWVRERETVASEVKVIDYDKCLPIILMRSDNSVFHSTTSHLNRSPLSERREGADKMTMSAQDQAHW